LLGYALAIAGIAVLIGAFRYVWRLCLLGTSRRVEEGLRNRLFDHLQTLSAAYFDRTRTGDLMAHATNDIQQIRMAAGMGLVAMNDAVVMGAAAIGFMLYIEPTLTGVVLIPMPFIAVAARFFSRRMHRRYRSVQASFSDLTEAVRERVAGIRLIKAHNRKTAEAEKIEAASRAYVDENLSLVRITGAFFPLMVLLTNLSMALVLFLGGRQTILLTITPGDFVAFISYLGLLMWPMMALGWVTNLIQRGRASLDRVDAILATLPDIRSAARPAAARPAGAIVFEAVGSPTEGAGAQTGRPLGIDRGSSPAPCSASSDRRAAARRRCSASSPLYDHVGRISSADGHPRRPVEDLRGRIAFMPQEPFLFAGPSATTSPSAGRGRRRAAHRGRPRRRPAGHDPPVPQGFGRWSANGGHALGGRSARRSRPLPAG
jgi:ATP-binding cassette subfamily B protein